MFTPSQTAALQQLQAFVPLAGRHYAEMRNFDDMAHVSALSPYIRHRILTEAQVLEAVLQQHDSQSAQKFIQEVFWRTYWKGWLELRPTVWDSYRRDLNAARNRVQTESGLRAQWEAACKGETGIASFDHWARQLVETGYLHNHARMWFASIWIYTLGLPWTLGADFFLRHLLDGDPASNTLSWRWVGGMQTIGKTYLALPSNIARYTNGRFHPTGLAKTAPALPTDPHPKPGAVPSSDPIDRTVRPVLLLTEEDLSLDWLLADFAPEDTVVVQATDARSPWAVSSQVSGFVAAAINDATARYDGRLGRIHHLTADQVADWCKAHDVRQLVTSYIPVGPTRDALAGLPLCQQVRDYDAATWPHATHGFFRFKDRIPQFLDELVSAH